MTFPEHLFDYSEVLGKIRAFASYFSYVCVCIYTYISIWNCVDVLIFLSIAWHLLSKACKVITCKLFKLPDIIITITTTKTTTTTTTIIINNSSNSSINKDFI